MPERTDKPATPDTHHPQPGYPISIGAEVHGNDGALGEVARVIVDARSDRITDLVVRHGFIFKTERVVPLGCVTGSEGSILRVDLDKEGFKALDAYDKGHFRAPDPDYVGPPGFDAPGMGRDNFVLSSYVAVGPGVALGGGGRTFGYPGAEGRRPRGRIPRPAVGPGTDVLDCDGEKVGEVEDIAIDPADGKVLRLCLKNGQHSGELPVEWVAELSDKGVILNRAGRDLSTVGEGR